MNLTKRDFLVGTVALGAGLTVPAIAKAQGADEPGNLQDECDWYAPVTDVATPTPAPMPAATLTASGLRRKSGTGDSVHLVALTEGNWRLAVSYENNTKQHFMQVFVSDQNNQLLGSTASTNIQDNEADLLHVATSGSFVVQVNAEKNTKWEVSFEKL